MDHWFKVTVKGFNQDPDGGRDKGVSEQFMFDALSYTEAEARAGKELAPLYREFEIKKIDPMNVSELFLDSSGSEARDKYFKCKVNYITLNEKTGKEKKKPAYIYVQASDPKDAEAMLTEGMKGTMSDWACESIVETKIIDVYKYDLSQGTEITQSATDGENE